jgi:tRNA dimethylallyltransferase
MIPGDYPAITVVGPTGSGKSQLGMELASRFRGEIISCDALQVYRHMDIGTAKASRIERESIPHHLLDLREPAEEFSAGDYQRLARRALDEIRHRKNVPIVVGGSGFYLRALVEGLFDGPGRNEELRERLRRIVRRWGVRRLHKTLRRVDSTTAALIMETDASRLIRALEIYFHTGRPMSWWQSRPRDALRGFRWLKLGIAWPREELYRRINARVEEMIRAGFVEEVGALLERFPTGCQALKAIGYRQISEYLRGERSLQEAVQNTQQESRRYAKRQLTWFRADAEIVWLDGSRWDELLIEADQRSSQFLHNA